MPDLPPQPAVAVAALAPPLFQPVQHQAGKHAAAGWGRRLTAFGALDDHDFRLFFIGNLGSFLSMNMQWVVRGYLAYHLTGSATALGLVTLAFGLPTLLLSPLGGALADRVDRRKLLILTQIALGLVILATALLIQFELIQYWHLVVLGLLQGAIFPFNMPARQAMVAELLGKEGTARGVALNNSAMTLMQIVGPSLAGLLITVPWVGLAGTNYLGAGLYLWVIYWLVRMRPPSLVSAGSSSLAAQAVAGLRYILQQRLLTTLLLLAFLSVGLGWPYQMLLPVFAQGIFDVGPAGLGMLMAANGAGALAGALLVAALADFPRKVLLLTVAGAALGVSQVLLGLSGNFALALVSLVLAGVGANTFLAVNNTLLMTTSEPAMHGRVMSVFMVSFAMMTFTSLPISAAADVFGAQPVVAACGLALVAVVVGTRYLSPALRRLP